MKIIGDSALLSLIFVLFIQGASCAAGKVSVQTAFDKKSIIIGDDLKYTLSLDFPEGSAFTPPDFQSLLSNFEVRNQKTESSKRHVEYKYTLTSYATGELTIGPYEIEFTLPGGEKENVLHPRLAVTVRFLEPGKNDAGGIRDIKPPVLPPMSPFVWAAVIFCAAAAGYFLLLKKPDVKTASLTTAAAPSLSPEEQANKRLSELESKKLAEQGLMKEYYVGLSNIIRLYIEAKYGVPVIERTTDELFADLRKVVAKKRNVEIREFLQSCDLVKFAKYVPGINASRADFERARGLINTQE